MTSFTVRSGRLVLWLIVTVVVLLAVTVTALRVSLPKLNHFQTEISQWVEEIAGVPFEIGEVKGYWRNTHPSLSLRQLNIKGSEQNNITLDIEEIQIEFDFIQSLLSLEPQVALLNMRGIELDIRHVAIFQNIEQFQNTEQPQNTEPLPDDNQTGSAQESLILKQIEKLLFRQLNAFTLLDVKVNYQAPDGKQRTLGIERLKWQNQANEHKIEGLVSMVDRNINSLIVKADFIDNGSVRDLSGDFYLKADNVDIAPWLAESWIKKAELIGGHISFNSWFTIKNNLPVDAFIELLPSELIWNKEQQHRLHIEEGVVKLTPDKAKALTVSGHALRFNNDNNDWPDIDFAFYYDQAQWLLNISQLDIESLRPLADFIPLLAESKTLSTELKTLPAESEITSAESKTPSAESKIQPADLKKWLGKLAPTGRIEDIRLSQSRQDNSMSYSANLISGGIKQWELLPEVHNMNANISGNGSICRIQARLTDDVLPYGDVFQAPLNIKHGEIDIVWESDPQGWRIWADRVTAITPDLQFQGAFKLDFPKASVPFLSLYATADLYNAGEVWRYLPTRALGQSLTDYLSTAIQGGKVNNATMVWYGALNQFPYQNHNGVFQAKVALEEGKFSFDTRWPAITDLQLNLLFENQAMYLDSRSATLMDVKAKRISGQIANLSSKGAVEIKAKASASGEGVRDYMMATPLVDSVGAALTTVKVAGNVASEFQLKIPFNKKQLPRVWGYADLSGNQIKIETPLIELSQAKGRIKFDNDIVHTSGLTAKLLQQPVSIDFKGENLDSSYSINIGAQGDWAIKPLAPYLGEHWTERVQGHAPWNTDIDIQLNDVGVTYQVNAQANLDLVSSQYPTPLEKALGDKGQLLVQASGNQQNISARLQLPNVKYQAEIDISGSQPVFKATNLLFGQGAFKVSPVVGHDVTVRMPKFNLDDWLALREGKSTAGESTSLKKVNTLNIPDPQRITLVSDTLTLASLDWHKVNFSARKKNHFWKFDVNSSEIKGQATYSEVDRFESDHLQVDLERLHVYLPALDKEEGEAPIFQAEEDAPLITNFDREFHHFMPNLQLNINDFWLQGYKVGAVNVEQQKQGKRLNWKNIDINSGTNHINAKGWWELAGNNSHSEITILMKGDNNTELMDRFGISSGIQKAPFEINSELSWHGAPWSLQLETLNGEIDLNIDKGIISDVSGAAKLLGMFSLDTIIRRMQLDFSNVFDEGIAFNRISGTGKVNNGVFITKNIFMSAPAGNMTIQGVANLNTNRVDAHVEFTPDLTSGIPILTAFAVAPQSALMVFAVSTVISPVIDVFTKIRYQIVGSLDAPQVKELSRSKEAYRVPKQDHKK